MDYEMLNSMKTEELKNFVRLRGLKVTGKKKNLSCKNILSIKNKVILIKTTQEVEDQLKGEYFKKLELENCTLPDPFKLEIGRMV